MITVDERERCFVTFDPVRCGSCGNAYVSMRIRCGLLPKHGATVVADVSCLRCGESSVVETTWVERVVPARPKYLCRADGDGRAEM